MPQTLLRFLQVVDNDNASVNELATLVRQNPSLCARLLTIANSAAMRHGKEITSIEQCLITLGTRLVRTLAACLAIQSVFDRTAGDATYDYTGFWMHSLRVAEIARAFAEKINFPGSDEAYLAGLLHDIGQLMLLGGVGESYGALLVCSSDEDALLAIEGPVLGTDHAVVGAWLVDRWELTSFVADAILFHHNSAAEIAYADRLSQILWSAHVVSGIHNISTLTSEEQPPEMAAAESLLGLDLAEIAAVSVQSEEDVAVLAAAFGITPTDDPRTHPYSSITFENPVSGRSGDEAQAELESAVRDMSLLQSLQHNLFGHADEAEMLIAARESARILFGLQKVGFLSIDPDQRFLVAPDIAGQPPLLKRLEIRLEPPTSLAAVTTLGDHPSSTFDEHPPGDVSLVDIQVVRAMSSEGVLYVPMHGRKGPIGIMICGLSTLQYKRISNRITWMTSFAHISAVSIEACRELGYREQNLTRSLTDRFEKNARKIIHEAGNPLSIIKNYLKIVSQKQPADSGISQELEILREEIDRVVNIVQSLSRTDITAPSQERVDVNAVIEGMLALYGEAFFSDRHIVLEKKLAPALSLVSGERDGLKQLLLNLLKNASEALSDQDTLTISTNDKIRYKDGLYVEIQVADSGPGLPHEVMQRLFQPLETSRPGHSGLGLAIVGELVERMGGHITCNSNGAGTTFTILLPLAEMVDPA
nr:HDOD domain-containing protein [Pelotalea chapellei]